MRTSSFKLNPILKNQIGKTFAQLICDIRSPKEADTFLKVFFNKSEYETFIKRMAVAYWLKNNRSYSNIKTNLKISSATIASIQNTLDSEGIKIALKKIEIEEWANIWAEKINKILKGK
ncbi:hypothetical protein KJ570_02025 [Patescibacteria group bacterium]|nr:hypothetical protein [Patescibacteria group bacterium]MBU2036225.1 hypothetical protein [Patescibacteria group bacterium]